jgi:hypothetical protein
MKTGTYCRSLAPGARAAGISRSQINRYSVDSELLGELLQEPVKGAFLIMVADCTI